MGRIQKIICIEIGVATIRICEMERGEKPKIYHFLEVNTPEGAVNDGDIDSDKLSEVAQIIVSTLRQNRIRTKKVIFTLFSSKIITREVMLPEMKEKQIKQVLEENINDYFPIELEDFRVTHTKIDTVIEADKTVKNKLLVIAAEKELVSQYEKLADMCRLTLIGVDYVGNSVYQALKKTPRFEPKMYVKADAENTLIMILEEDRLVLQRSLNYGMGSGQRDENEMREAIRPILGTIVRVLHFYSGQSYNHIESVTLAGAGADYVDMFNEVGEDGLVVYKTLKNSDENVILKHENLKEKIADFVACFGAGISPVNLINYKSSIKRVNYLNASLLMICLYVFIILSLGLMVNIPYLDATDKHRTLKKLEDNYAFAEEIYNTHQATLNFYNEYKKGDSLTKHANDGLLDFLEELEKKLPQDVIVSSLHSDDNSIIMQMEVSTKEEAAGTIETLRNFDSVMDVSVLAVSESEINETEEATVSFSITCTYYPLHQETDMQGE